MSKRSLKPIAIAQRQTKVGHEHVRGGSSGDALARVRGLSLSKEY